ASLLQHGLQAGAPAPPRGHWPAASLRSSKLLQRPCRRRLILSCSATRPAASSRSSTPPHQPAAVPHEAVRSKWRGARLLVRAPPGTQGQGSHRHLPRCRRILSARRSSIQPVPPSSCALARCSCSSSSPSPASPFPSSAPPRPPPRRLHRPLGALLPETAKTPPHRSTLQWQHRFGVLQPGALCSLAQCTDQTGCCRSNSKMKGIPMPIRERCAPCAR
ncbi:unnamed protein product, partial [Urochloa humidicola]